MGTGPVSADAVKGVGGYDLGEKIVYNGGVDFKYCSRMINMVMKWQMWITNWF